MNMIRLEAEIAAERRRALDDMSVAVRMKQAIDWAMSGLRSDLMTMVNDLSLEARDEVEKQIISQFGPQDGAAYKDCIVEITHSIHPELMRPERNSHVAEPFRSILNGFVMGVK